MTLVDTGPLVALFDPKDPEHERCLGVLRELRGPLRTTVPVLTETFHMLRPASQGADRVREFIAGGGLTLWFFDQDGMTRAFELMERYRDHPMDLADASLVTAAESLSTRSIFTMDRDDFQTYRVRRGHRHYPMELLP
jgi:predicted nucleic acid-binding protein